MKRNGERVGDRLDHTKLPDPVIEMLRAMQKEIYDLKAELKSLRPGQQIEEQKIAGTRRADHGWRRN